MKGLCPKPRFGGNSTTTDASSSNQQKLTLKYNPFISLRCFGAARACSDPWLNQPPW